MFSELSAGDQWDELGMNLDVPYVPTHESVVKAMLELAADGTRYRVELQQRYQKLMGELWINDQAAELQAALLWGDLVELVVHDDQSYGPESIVMHYWDEQMVVVGEYC